MRKLGALILLVALIVVLLPAGSALAQKPLRADTAHEDHFTRGAAQSLLTSAINTIPQLSWMCWDEGNCVPLEHVEGKWMKGEWTDDGCENYTNPARCPQIPSFEGAQYCEADWLTLRFVAGSLAETYPEAFEQLADLQLEWFIDGIPYATRQFQPTPWLSPFIWNFIGTKAAKMITGAVVAPGDFAVGDHEIEIHWTFAGQPTEVQDDLPYFTIVGHEDC